MSEKVQIYSKNRDKSRDQSMKLSNLKIQILLRRADWSIEIVKGSSEPGHQKLRLVSPNKDKFSEAEWEV